MTEIASCFRKAAATRTGLQLNADHVRALLGAGFMEWIAAKEATELLARDVKGEDAEERDLRRPFSVAMLAVRWNTSTTAIYAMIHRGEIRAFRLGSRLFRITTDEVERLETSDSDR